MSARRHDAAIRTFLRQVGDALRSLRREQDLQQQQLAARAETGAARIGEIERGEVDTSISRLWRIAGALGLKLSEFFARMELATGSEAQVHDRRLHAIGLLNTLPAEDLPALLALLDALAAKQRRRP